MAKKRRSARGGWLIVALEHVEVPDAPARLRRAFDLILRAAGRAKEGVTQDVNLTHGRKPKETDDA